MRILKHKRGGYLTAEQLVLTFWGLLFFAIVLVGFWLITHDLAKQRQDTLTTSARDLSVNTSILAYLRAPIGGNGEFVTVGEALARAAVTGDFAALHPDIQAFLERLPKPVPVSGWRYRVELLPEEQELDHLDTIDIVGWYEAKRSSFLIPTYDPRHTLRVTFALECQDVSCYEVE